eukprot:Phypoly_transcript_14406.p1 GENE.Phypoly_transcript_14406~~Phypoly_transcript_14406.p1  ORF type:complete len:258 (+),score=75.27 Phypoly_transcript_14406:176-949(+)
MELQAAGVTFATLLSSISLSVGDVEGFLIGSIVRKAEHVLLDASHSNARTNTHTQITQQYVLRHFLVTGSSGSFYDSVGNVDPDNLRNIVRRSEQDGHRVIGWFRARRDSVANLTMRESAVWRSILKLGPRHGHHDIFAVDPLLALFAVTPQTTTNALTFDYRFLDPGVGGLDPRICNLVSSSAIEYRELTVTWAGAGGPVYTPQLAPNPAIALLEKTHASALAGLVSLAQRAQEAQQQCVDLEAEIAALKKRNEAQ